MVKEWYLKRMKQPSCYPCLADTPEVVVRGLHYLMEEFGSGGFAATDPKYYEALEQRIMEQISHPQ